MGTVNCYSSGKNLENSTRVSCRGPGGGLVAKSCYFNNMARARYQKRYQEGFYAAGRFAHEPELLVCEREAKQNH
jgi:hypothetical protein